MGSATIRLYEDLLIYKSAGAEQPTPWHQDEPQWPVSGRQMVSAWFCLDPVTPATGALKFAAGTHRGPMYRPFVPPERAADLAADERYFEADRCRTSRARARFSPFAHSKCTRATYCSSTRACFMRRSAAPRPMRRRTFSIRFLGEDVRWLPKQSVYHEWLKTVGLRAGDRISGERFPRSGRDEWRHDAGCCAWCAGIGRAN